MEVNNAGFKTILKIIFFKGRKRIKHLKDAHNSFFLFTKKLHRTALLNNCLNTAHLGGPAHIILFAWFLLFTVSLHL